MKLSREHQYLHDLALQKSADYHRLEAELLDIVDRVDRSRLYHALGCNSLYAYCTEILKFSEGTAYNFINVARKSREIPELKTAVEAGLSVAKARRIAPVITKENQDLWIAAAQEMPRAKLERAVAEASPETARVESVRARRDDRVELNLNISAELMEQIRRAQDLVSQSQGRAATLEETLAAMTATYIERKDPVAKADRNLARAKSAKINIVHARDRGACQMIKANGIKCGATRHIDIHHIIPRHLDGTDEPDNLVTLCSTCHRLWHVEENRRWATGDVAGTEKMDLSWPGPSPVDCF